MEIILQACMVHELKSFHEIKMKNDVKWCTHNLVTLISLT